LLVVGGLCTFKNTGSVRLSWPALAQFASAHTHTHAHTAAAVLKTIVLLSFKGYKKRPHTAAAVLKTIVLLSFKGYKKRPSVKKYEC